MDPEKIKRLRELVSDYNVLFIEDNKETVDQLLITFDRLFKHIDSAYDGIEGLRKYQEFTENNDKYYDIVVTDIRMPNMDGIELSKRIKQINPSQHILVISAHNESNILQKLINIGINTYIHKPLDFNELLDSIYKISQQIEHENKTSIELNDTQKLNDELNALMNGYDSLVIASRTDLDGKITYVSEGFVNICGYSKDELLGKTHKMIRHPDMSNISYEDIWRTIKAGKVWHGNIKNRKKDGSSYWVKAAIAPYYDHKQRIIGYNSIREDITSQIEADELHHKVNILLNNSNEGYLLFNQELKISEGYSKKCLEIFEKEDIKDQNIADLLFSKVENDYKLFRKGIDLIFKTQNKNKIDNFLSLLPTQVTLKTKHIFISYKYITSDSIMVILSDISENIKLKSEIEKQRIEQKMIVQIIANINDFLELDENYIKLIRALYKNTENSIHLPEGTNDLLRELHTFKGLFYQMNMIYSPHAIHELETKIAKMKQAEKHIASLDSHSDIKFAYYKDLEIIDRVLGKEYLKEQKNIISKSKSLVNLKYKIKNIIKHPENINFKLQGIISQIDEMSYESLYEIFEKHISMVVTLGEDLNKPMKPLKITGESEIKVPPSLKPFFRNMVHIYKNCVDHGIEDSDIRLKRGKDIKGEIVCKFKHEQGFLFIDLSDDGGGIDLEFLKSKLISHNVLTKEELDELSETKILSYVFYDNFTTRDDVDDISGRGIGMSSIKKSIEKIKGTIKVINRPGEGLTFSMKIPMKKVHNVYESSFFYNETISIMETVVEKIKYFLIHDVKIDVIDSKFVNKMDLEDKINVMVNIDSGVKLSFALSFHKKLLEKFAGVFFIDITENESEFDKILEEIAKETVNTIIGLSLQDFPNTYKEGMLSIPSVCDMESLQNDIHDGESRIVSNIITTGSGNLISNLILKG